MVYYLLLLCGNSRDVCALRRDSELILNELEYPFLSLIIMYMLTF